MSNEIDVLAKNIVKPYEGCHDDHVPLVVLIARAHLALRSQQDEAVDETLERAARVCDEKFADRGWNGHISGAARACADAIRALKSTASVSAAEKASSE